MIFAVFVMKIMKCVMWPQCLVVKIILDMIVFIDGLYHPKGLPVHVAGLNRLDLQLTANMPQEDQIIRDQGTKELRN
jgi:hypothetical protein